MTRRLVTIVAGIGVMAFALAGCFGNGTTAANTGQPGSVGKGLYRTLGDKGGPCTIARVDATNKTWTYQNLTGGPLYVTVKPDDTSVTSTNCEPWLLAPFVKPIVQTTTVGSQFLSGDYRVKYEISPGTYTAPGAPGDGHLCVFERVSDFSHENGSNVIEHKQYAYNEPGPITVNIQSTDFGFWSENCGTWTKQS